MTPGLDDDVAGRLVESAYTALDVFGGSEQALLAWSRGLTPDQATRELAPPYFDDPSAGVLIEALAAADVVRSDKAVDAVRLRQFQETVELMPHFRAAELVRRPAPKAQVAFTFPEEVALPVQAAHLRSSLFVRVGDALRSATDRVLLASPYWSDTGTGKLRPTLDRVIANGIRITLAGARARRDGETYDHLAAMLRFAAALGSEGADVAALEFVPPTSNPGCIFHAKVVCGATGYLGSGNLTDAAMGRNIEAGVPLDHEVDVEQVWWMIDVLTDAGLLRPTTL